MKDHGMVTVVNLQGRVTVESGAAEVRQATRLLIEQGKKDLLLNLGGVDYIDSTGVGSLVASYTTTVAAGGRLKIVNANQKIQHLLDMTRLLSVFEVFESEDSALASFSNR